MLSVAQAGDCSGPAGNALPAVTREENEMARWQVLMGCAAIALAATVMSAQPGAPRNDLPQPYRTTRDWGQLPPGVAWAAVTAIEPAPDGTIYVIHRCFENSCAGRPEAPILKYDSNGKLLASWGQGMFIFPHGATVDRDGNRGYGRAARKTRGTRYSSSTRMARS